MEGKKTNNKALKNAVIIVISCCLIVLAVITMFNGKKLTSKVSTSTKKSISTQQKTTFTNLQVDEEKVKYLSDMNFITSNRWSYVSWGGLRKDLPPEGNVITLKVNNENKTFLKGVGMHATSQLTVDISQLSQTYTRFVSKAGIDASRGTNGNGVWFRISVSNDGENWTNLIEKSSVQKGNTEALDIDLNVEGYKYLRIYADNNGNESSDHAVLGDAKLVTEDYVQEEIAEYDKIHTLEYYDNILKDNSVEYNYQNNYRNVIERELVSKIGYDTMKGLTSLEVKKYRDLFDWILSENDNIEQIIEVGELQSKPFINVLADLYSVYKNDLTTTNGPVYKKMMIALAASYSSDHLLGPLAFGAQSPNYDYIERFDIMKYLYDNNKFMRVNTDELLGEFVHNDWVKDYHIQLMRIMMQEPLRNDEIVWLNDYTHKRGGYSFYWYAYVTPVYNKPEYQAEANRETYTTKYMLNNEDLGKYKVPYGDGAVRFWMTLENGGICWNASRGGQSMFRVNGLPAVGAYQPGHELYIGYYQTDEGKGYWATRYGNWGNAGTTWGGSMRYRLLFNWANKYFTDQNIGGPKGGTSTGYLYLGQANLNNLEAYQKSLYYNLTANSYTDNNKKKETYWKSLEVNDINLDTYDNLINLYKTMSVKNEGGTITSQDWRALSEKIITAYEHHPVALYDLLKVIRPYLEGADKVEIDALEKETLERAYRYQSSDKAEHAEAVRTHAGQLLNKTQEDPVSFSFDGENAKQIVRNPNYDIGIAYSLDGGATFTQFTSEQKITLTEEEIQSITPENDIIIKFMGLTRTFTIDITKGTIPSNLYNNDLENRIINAIDAMEWRFSDTEEWTSYRTAQPDLTGNKTVQVRLGNTGTHTVSDMARYTFTADNQPDTEKYIPISRLSLHAVSSEEPTHNEGALNALDGDIGTIWHSKWDGSDNERYIVIEIDREVFLSALQYYPRQEAANGRIRSALISVSTDGENWTDVVTSTDWANNGSPKKVTFSPRKAKYVRLKANTYYGDGRSFASASMINLFEDTTSKLVPNFSFDGVNAGKIFFEGEADNIIWKYSVDGGTTWKDGEGSSYQLSEQEINSINSQNKIQVQMTANGQTTVKSINIQKGNAPSINPYKNDWENRLINPGDVTNHEWKIENESNTWTSYEEQEPVVQGTKTLLVRRKATGMVTASDAARYSFTDDAQPETRKYIPIKHLSIHQFSSEATGAGQNGNAIYAIDGDERTRWITNWNGTDRSKYIIIKLDKQRYITGLEYKPQNVRNGKIQNVTVLVSEDGQNWKTVTSNYRWSYNNEADDRDQTVNFTATKGKYVKIVGTTTQSSDRTKSFMAARQFRLFEDKTKIVEPEPVIPTAEIEYTPAKPADSNAKINQDVVARLINPSTNITITNNEGRDTYTFTQNGEFTFEFVDDDGNKGMTTATVNWIDKVAPVGTISYNINETTNQNVRATITFDKQNVRITNNNGQNTYTFNENGEFTFEFVGPSGNTGTATARVNWIDRTAPVATIEYNTTNPTNQDVIATIKFDKQNVRITNNNGNNTYTFSDNGEFTFEYVDQAGNTGTATANVDWINKTIPRATISYSPTCAPGTMTNQDVVATITFDRNNVEVDGGNTHTFTSNGSYTFRFRGPYGNEGEATATVDWIDKVAPTARITYNTLKATNQPVEATITFDKENVRITNNDGNNTYTFDENGEFTFEFIGPSGNTGTAVARVTWIDKEAPRATITYDINERTNRDVTATITFDKENVTIRNNDGKNTYTFTENGEFEFTFVGPAGNVGSAIAKVTWIDKDAIIPIIRYSETNPTNQDVTATITFNKEDVTVQNNNGSNTYTFTENGTFDFYYADNAGNYGKETAVVSWIDKVAPEPTIEYSKTTPTNQNVVATITFNEQNVTMRNNDGKNTYEFTENGEFTFLYVDEAGNKGAATATVTWIDRQLPKATITYSTTDVTNQHVTATITFDKENVTITNNGGNTTYTFMDNGEFTFDFVDEAGNIGTKTAAVDWIDPDFKDDFEFEVEEYNIEGKYITNITPGLDGENATTVSEFKGKITTNQDIELIDKEGNTLNDDDIVTTGTVLKVGEKFEYTLIVKGDINGNGEITIDDLAKLKLHCLEVKLLEGAYLKAADLDTDKEITINDIAQIKLALIGMQEIK